MASYEPLQHLTPDGLAFRKKLLRTKQICLTEPASMETHVYLKLWAPDCVQHRDPPSQKYALYEHRNIRTQKA